MAPFLFSAYGCREGKGQDASCPCVHHCLYRGKSPLFRFLEDIEPPLIPVLMVFAAYGLWAPALRIPQKKWKDLVRVW